MSDIIVPMQEESFKTWSMKHRVFDKDGNPIDGSIEEAQVRVARALAGVEKKDRAAWEKKFVWAMQNGAVPAGRIFSNAGAQDHKNKVSLINCVVSDTILDSMDSILGKLHEAGMSLKAGCGIGYEFSTLRFNGAYVQGAGATTSGPLSFMDIYDKMCRTVSSAGGRRGAQMATFDIRHPDIFEYIEAKRHNKRKGSEAYHKRIQKKWDKRVLKEGSDCKLAVQIPVQLTTLNNL
jgi:ribonucleoside-diphosphate reductase alpha chain